MKNIMRHRLVRVGLAGGLALCLSGVAVNAGTASATIIQRTQTVAYTAGTIDATGHVHLIATGTFSDGSSSDITMDGSIGTGTGLGTSKAKVTNAAVLAGGTDPSGAYSVPFTTGGTKQVITGTVDGVVPVSTSNGSLTNYKIKSISITCTGAYPPLTFGCSATLGFDIEQVLN
jgi:hypothetical protein